MTPKAILYGERYGDDSGWEWAVSLDPDTYGSPRVVIEAGGSSVSLDFTSVDLHAVAEAMQKLANLVDGEVS